MACCGASLRGVTNFAGIFTLTNFIFFVALDGFLVACLRFPNSVLLNPSPGFEVFVRGFESLRQADAIFVIFVIRLILRLIWLLTVPLLFVGNRNEKRVYVASWERMSYLMILLALVFAGYFVSANYECGYLSNFASWTKSMTSRKPSATAGVEAAKFVVFFALFDGGLVFLVPSVLLTIQVRLRSVQMHYRKREDTIFRRWESGLAPYRIPRAKLSGAVQSPGDDSTLAMSHATLPQARSTTRSRTVHQDIGLSRAQSQPTTLDRRFPGNQNAFYENTAYDPEEPSYDGTEGSKATQVI